jgi:putative inorganic carbon (hco3(-)) transporter
MQRPEKKLNNIYFGIITGLVVAGGAVAAAYFSWLAIPIVLALLFFITTLVIIFDKPWLGVVLVAFFLPFERIGGFNIMGETTLRISQVLAVATIAGWLLYYLIIRKKSYPQPLVFWPLLAYLAIAALSIINSINVSRAVSVFIFTMFVIVLALIIPQLIRREKHLRLVIISLLLSALAVSLFGLYQFAGDVVGLPASLTGLREHYTQSVFGFPRVHATALEPLYFANYLLIPIAIAFMLWVNRSSLGFVSKAKIINFINRPWFLLAVVLFGATALILALSRGGYLGLAATGIALTILGWRKIFKLQNIILIIVVALVIIIGAVSFINFSGKFSLDTFLGQATEFQTGAGIEERFSTFTEAEKLFRAHPLLGIGIGSFGPEVAKYPHRMPEGGWLIVNNETLEILCENGILGLGAIIITLVIIYGQGLAAWARARQIADTKSRVYLRSVLGGSLAALTGILVQYQTFSTLYIIHIWFLIGLICALVIVINNKLSDPGYEN